jgi:hypothetical protein
LLKIQELNETGALLKMIKYLSKFAVTFVVHGGELQIKSLMLAASLRKYWPLNIDLIACMPPGNNIPVLHDAFKNALGVRIVEVSNPIADGDYPIGNKLLCLDVETEADRVIFLDSDIIALQKVSDLELTKNFGQGFVAKPADLATFKANPDVWNDIYRACDAEMPGYFITATTSGEKMPPYFNAGLISVKANSGFGRSWSECAKKIEQMPDVRARRRNLDQIALPVAAAKSGQNCNLIGEDWNYPAHLKPLPNSLPKLCHYHWPEVIAREPSLLDAVEELTARVPQITECAQSEENWYTLVRRTCAKRTRQRPRNLPIGVITGIPRSGTSYLCALLHELKDHVVINEPAEVFTPLNQEAPGHRTACYYLALRRRILDGEAVENKTKGGKIIEDTAHLDVRTAAPISIEREDFALWTKNTIAYLNRLPYLLEAIPEAKFIACVRHPVDTIASWSRTFLHLRNADVERFPIGYPTDPFLSSVQRAKLAEIAACHDLPRRRAMLWNYLAEIILQHQDRLIIVRLEDLAVDPAIAQDAFAVAQKGINASTPVLAPRFLPGQTTDAGLDEYIDGEFLAALGYRNAASQDK